MKDFKQGYLDFISADGNYYFCQENGYLEYGYLHKDYYEEHHDFWSEIDIEDCKSERIRVCGGGEYSAEKMKLKFILNNWSDSWLKKRDFLSNIIFFADDESNIFNFINSLPLSGKDRIKLLLNIPLSSLYVDNIDLNKLRAFAEVNGISDIEKDNFYVLFFKSREKKLVGEFGRRVEGLLLDLYGKNREKLEVYESFFVNIKNVFNEVDLDVFDEIFGIFTVRLNIKKASRLLNGYNENLLFNTVVDFSNSYAKLYDVQSAFDDVDRRGGTIEIRFYKLLEVVDVSCSKIEYTQFLQEYLKETTKIVKVEKGYEDSWLLKRFLQRDCSDENKSAGIKNKI